MNAIAAIAAQGIGDREPKAPISHRPGRGEMTPTTTESPGTKTKNPFFSDILFFFKNDKDPSIDRRD